MEWVPPEPRPPQQRPGLSWAARLIFLCLKMRLTGFIASLRSQFLLFLLRLSTADILSNSLGKHQGHGVSPFSLQMEEFNGQPSDGSGCFRVDFKRLAFAWRNMNRGRGVCHTHSIVVSVTRPQLPPHWLHTLILRQRLSVFLTIALFGLMEEYEQHLAEPRRYANLFHRRRFDKLDCSS